MKSVSKNALPREAGFLLYFYRERREQMQGGSAQRRGSISKHMLTLFYYYSGRLHQDSQPGEKNRQDRWIFLSALLLQQFGVVCSCFCCPGWRVGVYIQKSSQPHTPTHPITAKQALTLTATWHYALYYKSLLSLKEHCLHVKCIWLSIQGVL